MADPTHFPLQPDLARAEAPNLPEVLTFGTVFSPHMVSASWDQGEWRNPLVTRLEPIPLEPHAACLHYGQTVFEGLKAFRQTDGSVAVFRPERHAARFRQSTDRLCMPPVSTEMFVAAVNALVDIDRDWVPRTKDASLYIRPAMIATEPFLGVRPSRQYKFFVMGCPVSGYYAKGFGPVRIWIEREFVRAAAGGLGAAKTGANYVASMLAAERAHERGYDQVLWTDASTHERIEEVGTMNVFIRLRDRVITPRLSGTLLDGVTRNSVMQVLADWSIPCVETEFTVTELLEASRNGTLLEVFGSGTGAVISPVSHLGYEGGEIQVGDGKTGELSQRLFTHMTSLQRGEVPDRHQWLRRVG